MTFAELLTECVFCHQSFTTWNNGNYCLCGNYANEYYQEYVIRKPNGVMIDTFFIHSLEKDNMIYLAVSTTHWKWNSRDGLAENEMVGFTVLENFDNPLNAWNYIQRLIKLSAFS